ncbi:MAG: response regulator [Oscillatoria sp. PMC 1068.18]|nr:response regulator [Oscillatoria sp. PMC 1076.18]MEC4989639.1 response regulator [Oscillatoria sp. PMC 1068.18]
MKNNDMGRPIEILLVEDSVSDAKLTMKSLANGKIANNLHWVEDGETAIAYLKNEQQYPDALRPDLIILDLNLPGMDGREVLAEIKSDQNLKIIPIVIVTSSNDEEDIYRSYNLHANCFVTKPVELEQFLQVVQLIENFWLVAVKLPTVS